MSKLKVVLLFFSKYGNFLFLIDPLNYIKVTYHYLYNSNDLNFVETCFMSLSMASLCKCPVCVWDQCDSFILGYRIL